MPDLSASKLMLSGQLPITKALPLPGMQTAGGSQPEEELMHGRNSSFQQRSRGFTMLETAMVILILGVLVAITLPFYNGSRSDSQMNSTVGSISAVLTQTRYAAIMNSQVYTVVFTAPANTYVVTNVATSTSQSAVPLPYTTVLINTGTAATYTFTFCPNGIAYGAVSGLCPPSTVVTPPVLTLSNLTRKVQLNVSSVGNVTPTSLQ
jgi:prepilin-type N-terminal cleavage/methylation domain-containing protein